MSNERTLPHNLEAEKAILGAILLHADALNAASAGVEPGHFFRDAHRRIFTALQTLELRGEPVELITLKAELDRKGELDEVGGPAYLAALVDGMPRHSNVAAYASIVRDQYDLRELIDAGTKMLRRAYEAEDAARVILDDAQYHLFDISVKSQREDGFVHVKESVPALMDRLEDLRRRKEVVNGVPSGFHDLDDMTCGFQPEDLILIAARPSMGKTSLAMNIAEYVSQKVEGSSVAVSSLEMSRQSLLLRQLASLARVDSHRLRGGFLGERDWARLSHALGVMSEATLYIDDAPNQTVFQIRAKAKRLMQARGLTLLIVDYLQLAEGQSNDKRKIENRALEVAAMSRGLKGLAKELKIPVIVLSQLNRSSEHRSDHRPQLSDLRESGALEQDADVVLLLYREEYYDPQTEAAGIVEVIIAKQRNGPTGTVKLAFIKEHTRFESLTATGDQVSDRRLPMSER